MANREGFRPLLAGFLIVPVIILGKLLGVDHSPGDVAFDRSSPPAASYEATLPRRTPPLQQLNQPPYTDAKVAISAENIAAALPAFSTISDGLRPVEPRHTLPRANSPLEQIGSEYVGRLGCGENGSCYGDLNTSGVPKEVFVEGYHRSDGTYVRSHYRSRPNK